jgi:phosphate:Na+ symporter
MVWLVKPLARLVQWIVPERVLPERPMEEPKFLTPEALAYPETAIAALEQESRYLYEHAVFEIVSHALSLHREDILSERKAKSVVKKSREDLQADVRELYLTRVKRIYSEIIAFAINAQSDLPLTGEQHQRVSELKLANRKMVEIIKDAREVKRNVSRYLKEGHKVMIEEYDEFRKKMVKVLRVIREFEEGEVPVGTLAKLSQEAAENIQAGNLEIDTLIREKKVTPEMASSLVNDHDNLNDMIENLIDVARLLYNKKDLLAETEKQLPAKA